MRKPDALSTRRMGPVDSPKWHAMLDAAEAILREEGYGALSSRRVAERSGFKQQLLYYYFQTMDDLIVEAFRRSASRELERLSEATASERPLHELWTICLGAMDVQLIIEFMALANRIEGLRGEIVSHITRTRSAQREALVAALEKQPDLTPVSPSALAILATGAALLMNRERALGIELDHDEVSALITAFLTRAEPEPESVHR